MPRPNNQPFTCRALQRHNTHCGAYSSFERFLGFQLPYIPLSFKVVPAPAFLCLRGGSSPLLPEDPKDWVFSHSAVSDTEAEIEDDDRTISEYDGEMEVDDTTIPGSDNYNQTDDMAISESDNQNEAAPDQRINYYADWLQEDPQEYLALSNIHPDHQYPRSDDANIPYVPEYDSPEQESSSDPMDTGAVDNSPTPKGKFPFAISDQRLSRVPLGRRVAFIKWLKSNPIAPTTRAQRTSQALQEALRLAPSYGQAKGTSRYAAPEPSSQSNIDGVEPRSWSSLNESEVLELYHEFEDFVSRETKH